MTVTVANTANTSTFQYWVNRTNELAYAMSTQAVTVNSAIAVGNGGITGTFSANSFASGNTSSNVMINTSSIEISNSTANITITIPTTQQIANGNYYQSSNGNWTQIPVYQLSQNFIGTNPKQVDSWPLSQYTGADYFVSIIDTSTGANNSQTTKILAVQGTGNAYSTEYGTLITNTAAGSIGAFNANTDGTNFYLWFTPNSTNTTVKFVRVII